MDMDQRLEALRERHEALTQSVELMNHQLETDGKYIREVARLVQTTNENVNALLRIVESHERRLTDLDGGA